MITDSEYRNLIHWTISSLIVLIIVLFPFIWEQHKSIHPDSQYIALPNFARFIDSIVLMGSFVFIVIHKSIITNERYLFPNLVGTTLAIFMLGVLSIALNGWFNGNLADISYYEGIAKYMRPFLVIVILTNLPVIRLKAMTIFKLLFYYGLLNATIGWYQVIFLNAHGDFVFGLLRSSHFFASFMFILSIAVFSYARHSGKMKYYFIVIYLMLPALLASHIRGNVILFATIFIYTIIRIFFSQNERPIRKLIIALIIWVPISIGSYFMFKVIDEPTTIKLTQLSKSIKYVGFLQGYKSLPDVMSSNPIIPILGKGPGQYGSGVSFSTGGAKNIYKSQLFFKLREEIGALQLVGTTSFLNLQTTTIFAIIAEWGFIVFVLYIYFYYILCRTIHQSTPKNQSWLVMFSDLYLIFILLFSLVDSEFGLEAISLVLPWFALIGLLLRRNKDGNVGLPLPVKIHSY